MRSPMRYCSMGSAANKLSGGGRRKDAFRCFMGTDIEVLVVGNCLLRKDDQNPALRSNYSHSFERD